MRERLIELLKQQICRPCVECEYYDADLRRPREYCAAESRADHLLANGVIVPPCKVGQKLYTVCTRGVNDKFIQESTVSKIVLDDFDGLRIIKKVVDERGCCFFYDVDQEQLNKTTFFSKEEAERVLKGDEV
jgi:hypothetical protein